MITMQAPNGATIEAAEESVKNLLDMGFRRVSEEGQEPKPKAAPRKRTTRKKG